MITGASPRPKRKKPGGISLGRLNPTSPRPTTPITRPVTDNRCPANCTAAAPTAASPAAHRDAAGAAAGSRGAGVRTARRTGGSIIAAPTASTGRTAQKTARQSRWWVSQAATAGPTNDGTTQAAEM